jgi:hypothetical protein
MNKIWCKNGKYTSKEVSKIKIFNYNKKICKPWMKLSCQFLKNPWVLMVSWMGFYAQKSKKIPNSLYLSGHGHVIPLSSFLAGDLVCRF